MSAQPPKAGRRAAAVTPSTAPLISPIVVAEVSDRASSPSWMDEPPMPISPPSLPPVESKPTMPTTPVQKSLVPTVEVAGDLPWLAATAPPVTLNLGQATPLAVEKPLSGYDLPFLFDDTAKPDAPPPAPSDPPQTQTTTAPPRPKTRDELNDELLNDLHTTEGDIMQQEIVLKRIEGDARRSGNSDKLQVEKQRAEVQRQLVAVDKKRRDDEQYLRSRLQSISSKQITEAVELNVAHRGAQIQRKRLLMDEVKEDIISARRELDRLRSQRELLNATNPWEEPLSVPTVLGARLSEAASLNEKLSAATDFLLEHHSSVDSRVERRVAQFINLETALAADANVELRRRAFRDESHMRMASFSGFKTKLVEKSAAFHSCRHDSRTASIQDIQQLQRKVLKDLRDQSVNLAHAAQADARSQFEAAQTVHKELIESEILRIRSKFGALLEQDDTLANGQRSDMESRFHSHTALVARLQDEEFDALNRALVKEAERAQSALLDGQARVSNVMRSHDGSAIHDSAELFKAASQLGDALQKALVAQSRRNAAFQLSHGADDDTYRGASTKEATLMGLLREKQEVLSSMQATSKQQLQQLSASREALLSVLSRAEGQMETLASRIHDGRLQQQASLGRIEVCRAAWENEHRAMLSFGSRQGEPDVNFRDGGVGFHPALQVLLTIAREVSSNARRADELHTTFSTKRKALLNQQHTQDVQVEGEGAALAGAWQSLMEKMLDFNDEFKRISAQQVVLLGEEAKIAVETDLLQNERASLAKRSASLHREQDEIRERGRKLRDESSQVAAANGTLERESAATAEEVGRLVQLQTELRKQQVSHFSDLRRLDNAKSRMLGVWAETRSYPTQVSLQSSSSPTVDHDASFVPVHYFPPSTSSSSARGGFPAEAVTEPPSPVSSGLTV